jgi:uncharacterized surface anchored protein
VVKETQAKSGYVLDDTPQTAKILAGQTVTLEFRNAPTGGLLIKKMDASTKEPLSDVIFKVTTTDGTVVGNSNGEYRTDERGYISIPDLEPGGYIVQEVQAKTGYLLDDTPKSIEIKDHQTYELEFFNQPLGNLIINKLDSVTKKPLAGVQFKITYANGSYVDAEGGKLSSNGLYTTDSNGQIVLSGITGTVVVTEVQTIEGYTIDENTRSQTVVVNPDDTQTLTFYNTPAGGLQIIKSDEDTGERIKGVKFEVRKMNGEIIGTYTTDQNGVISIPNAESGWYTVTELKAADGYKLDATPAQVCVKDGETATLELTNKRMSSIMIHKIDADTGEGIYGVKFILYDEGKTPIGEYTSDQDGYVWINNELEAGKYFLRELEAAEGYILDEQYKTVYVERGECTQIEWKNTAITGQIQITKYAAEYNTVTGQAAGTTLQGAVYEITQERSGAVVGYITTDARGVAASEALPLGRYIVREVTAPAYWQISDQKFDVTLEYTGQIIKLADYDKPAQLGVSITKTGNQEILAGSKMVYRFTVANTSNVALESFYWHDKLPYDVTGASALTTGTYSQRLNYRVLYKTNYNDYRVLASNLLSTNNYSFALSALPLMSGEVVTDIYFDFGTVPAGFQSVTQPTLTVSVSPTATNGYYITNRADAGGKYSDTWQTANSSWVTIVRNLTPTKTTTLPKTGY